jgi:hypothetical protein
LLLIGSHEQMAAQMLRQAEELGITSYVVREPAVPELGKPAVPPCGSLGRSTTTSSADQPLSVRQINHEMVASADAS